VRIKLPKIVKPKRDRPVTIRFAAHERDAAEDRARAAGLSISDYGRHCMLDHDMPRRLPRPARRPPFVIPAECRELYQSLARVGNNLNQMAHALNLGDTPALRDVRAAIHDVVVEVRRIGLAVFGTGR
jgi:hypothetical protein